MKFSNMNYQKQKCSRSPAYQALLNKYDPVSQKSHYTKLSSQMLNKKLSHKNGRKTNPLGTVLQKQSNEIVFYKSHQNQKPQNRINKYEQQQHVEALINEAELLKQKRMELQNEFEDEKLKECTFSPFVVAENSYRNPNQVLEDMKKADQKQAQKLLQVKNQNIVIDFQLKNEQEQKAKETVSFQPNKSCSSSCWFSNTSNFHLSPSLGQSVTLLKSPNQSKLSKQSNATCHDRLYNDAKQKWMKNLMPGKENQPPTEEEVELEIVTNRSKMSGFFSPQVKLAKKKSPSKSPCISQVFEKSYYESRKGNLSEYLYADGLEKMSQKGKNNKKEQQVLSNTTHQYANKAQDLQLTKLIIKELMNSSYEVFDSENEWNIIELSNQKLINKQLNYNQIWQILIRIGFFQQVNLNNTSAIYASEEINLNNFELSSQQQLQLENQYGQLNRMLEFLNLDINSLVNIKILCVFVLLVLGVQITNQIQLLINEEFGQGNEMNENDYEQMKLIKTQGLFQLKLNSQIEKQIKKEFSSLAQTRMSTAALRRTLTSAQAPQQQQTFLSARSRQLSSQRRAKLLQLSPQTEISSHCSENTIKTHADVLFLERQIVNQKVLEMKNNKQFEEMSQCTFKPKINEDKQKTNYTLENQENWQNDNMDNSTFSKTSYCKKIGKIANSPIQRSQELYEISQRFQSRFDRTGEEIEFEKQQNECTFNPNLIGEQRKNKINRVPLREFEKNAIEKNISRIGRGREMNEYLLRSLERSPEIINKNPLIMKQENTQKQFNKNSSNQSINESQNLPQPISIAEIHLSPSYSEKIYIYPGDSSLKLAQEFAFRHQLNETMTIKLQEMLENKILSSLQ